MTFLGFANPAGLLGLLALPVVLALHLMRQRQQRYAVSSLTLWSFLEQEVRGSRFRRIPLSLLLMVDLLIAILLSLAWAQPQLQLFQAPAKGRQLILLLDSSASMAARDALPTRYEQAKTAALAQLTALGPRDSATIITFGARPAVIGDTRTMALADLTTVVTASQAGESASTALPAALALAQASAQAGIDPEYHIYTDAAFPELPVALESGTLAWHLYGNNDSNQAVFDVTAEPAGDGWQVFARIANLGSGRVRRIVTLFAGDSVVESTTLEILPGSTVAQLWSVSGQPDSVTVQLAGSDALPEDDSASIGLHQIADTRVAVVTADPEPLHRVLELLPGVTLRLLAPEEYVPGMTFDLTIFRNTLPSEWPAGIVLVLDPPPDSASFELGPAERLSTVAVPVPDPVLDGIDFAGVRWGAVRTLLSPPAGYLSLLQAGQTPLLMRGEGERGLVYLFLPELEGGNFLRHPAFPLLIVNLVASATASPLPLQLSAGDELPLPRAVLYPQLQLLAPDGTRHDLSSNRPAAWDDTHTPGRYRLELTGASGEEKTVVVGVNTGSLAESNIRPGRWPEDVRASGAVQEAAIGGERTLNLMPWLLAAAALLLLAEGALAWR